MSSTLSLSWILLSCKGDLPDELILKILLQFNGLQHPLVKLLLNKTKIDDAERLRKLPFSRSIQRHYYKYGVNDELFTLLNNKQNLHFIYNCSSYLHWTDPGYFIPRQKGRLYYSVLNDNSPIETTICVNFKLERSKKIIEKIKCITCSKLYINDYFDYNNDYKNFGSYTNMLMSIERNTEINKYLCRYCYDVAFNHPKLN